MERLQAFENRKLFGTKRITLPGQRVKNDRRGRGP